jgi:hypothetical protein
MKSMKNMKNIKNLLFDIQKFIEEREIKDAR